MSLGKGQIGHNGPMTGIPTIASSMQLVMPSTPQSVPQARRVVDALLGQGFRQEDHDRIALAVSEACTNVVLHAYRDCAIGVIALKASTSPSRVTIRITDTGLGVVPRLESPGAGFGIMLMRRLSDEMHLERSHESTVVEMTFITDQSERECATV